MAESSAAQRLKIGYALAPKKVTSFIKPSLIDHAALRGIDLIPVDPAESLFSQGPFDCLIHKLHDQDWKNKLLQFASANPDVPIVDHPHAIDRLHSRITMLQLVPQLDLANVDVPKQIVFDDSHSFCSDLRFPVIAKPLVADGSADSHDMLLIFNQRGLAALKPPVVLQEFVNHGGVIFKIYVVGQHVECVTRRSLSDISAEKMKTLGDSISFSQISNLTAANYNTSKDDFLGANATDLGSVSMPPLSFVTDLALRLRQALGLNLFNFDLIRDGERYLVIDINYFPGYAKMPNYETVLTEFFWDVVHKNPNVVLPKPSP
ncbi:hypothetical protein QQ045_011474 [Rhodiola kirilowii]